MGKKLIGIAVIVIMLFGVFGLTACDNVSLDEYKVIGKALIDDHVATKTQSDYCTDKWAELCNLATAGKQAVEDATNKGAVDTAVDNAKIAINAVEEEIVGAFYTLQEAFDEDWLTAVDLKNIAFYYRGNSEDGFVASAKNPAELSTSTESKIKQLYLSNLQKKVPEATLVDIRIAEYYGTYGICVAVKVWDDCVDYDLSFIPEQLIGGVLFTDYCEREIYIYKTAK